MAAITTKTENSIFRIQKWLGVNENPDGDTKLKLGEAAEMRNFRITRDGNLQLRPGTKTVCEFDGPVRGLWRGNVAGAEYVVCAAGGGLWTLELEWEGPVMVCTKTQIGALIDAPTEFFGFGGKLYIQNGYEYMSWDGENEVAPVEGYRPLVAVAVLPDGSGAQLEQVNKLTGARRARYSPDGESGVFQLPGDGWLSVDYVKSTATGEPIEHTANAETGTVTFFGAPESGVDSIEIGWTVRENDRAAVVAMRFSELYGGATDSRVFLYGDGGSAAIYSGLDNNGAPSADYFPDLNVLHAGEENTPITGMIRHFTRLLIFKSDSAYIAYAETLTLADGSLILAFYVNPINRELGCSAMGQVRLVTNNPYVPHGGGLYEWKSGGGYLGMDERNAKRISGRVGATLAGFDSDELYVFDDENSQEYYLVSGGRAIVYNYDEDAWCIYADFPASRLVTADGEIYMGTPAGELRHVSRRYRNDDGRPISAFWRSGSIDFDRDWQRKYSAMIFVSIKPESGARLTVTARSNRKSEYPDKIVSSSLATFGNADFNHWSFATNRQPQVKRLKLKVKKVTYYQLILESLSASATATILAADINIRYTGNVK